MNTRSPIEMAQEIDKLRAQVSVMGHNYEQKLHDLRKEMEAVKERSFDTGDRLVIALDEKEQWQRQAFEMQNERDAALAKLDICKRYTQGEGADGDCCDLANDYGGSDYEKDPACLAVAKLQQDHVQAREALQLYFPTTAITLVDQIHQTYKALIDKIIELKEGHVESEKHLAAAFDKLGVEHERVMELKQEVNDLKEIIDDAFHDRLERDERLDL